MNMRNDFDVPHQQQQQQQKQCRHSVLSVYVFMVVFRRHRRRACAHV